MSTSAQFDQLPLFHPRQHGEWKCQYRIPNLLVSRNGVVFALPEERVNSVADEACLVELSAGVLYVNSRNESLRCCGYRAWDRSHDGGDTFNESGYDLGLPEPRCAIMLARFNLEWLRGEGD